MKKYIFSLICCLSIIFLMLSCEQEEPAIPRIKISLNITEVSSFGAKDGKISADAEGGTPPYQFFWDNGEKGTSIEGLAAGSYTLRVVDSYSAVASETVILAQPEATPLGLQFNQTSVSWFGGNDGALSVRVSGGTPPYTYLWENGEEEADLDGLLSGIYIVTVTDAGNPAIVTTDSVLLTQPDFVCGRDSITDVNGNKYPTVSIGEQCWLSENLRTLNNPKDPTQTIDGLFCDGTNCNGANGAHYTWDAMMNGAISAAEGEEVQGVCPCEWHIPTKEEWDIFNSHLSIPGNGGDGINVPNKIRGTGSPSGFNALNAGNWGYDVFAGENAVFWAATEQSEDRAFYRILNNFPLLGQGHIDKRSGLSVRCVQNK